MWEGRPVVRLGSSAVMIGISFGSMKSFFVWVSGSETTAMASGGPEGMIHAGQSVFPTLRAALAFQRRRPVAAPLPIEPALPSTAWEFAGG
jgi:hypothetical protein